MALISDLCIPIARNIPIEVLRSSANMTKILITRSIPATTVKEPNTKKKPATFSDADSEDSTIDRLISLTLTSYKPALASSSIQSLNCETSSEKFVSLVKS